MKKVAKLINFPEVLIVEIEKYQKKYGVSSFTATVLELIRIGLNNGSSET